MTATSASNLSQSKIQRLLSAVGSAPAVIEPTPEATAYDWCDPQYFDEDQRNRLAATMTKVAALLSDRFAHFYQSEFNVKVVSIAQQFADGLSRQLAPDQSVSLPFGPDPAHPCGFLTITAQTAIEWAARLLGDAEAAEDPNHTLSSLEESLLADLLTAIAKAFLSALGDTQNLQPGPEVCQGVPVMPYESTAELCLIVFQVHQGDADEGPEIRFVLSCEALAPLVGKTVAPQKKPPQEQLTRLLMEHIYDVPVPITVRLATTRLSFEDVLDLAADDVLLIDKPLPEPADVIIADRVVFRGSVAQSAGQYAVFVTECAGSSADTPQPSPVTS